MNAELWLLAGGAALAGLVQGISGFAFAMVAMSVWVWGIEPRLAAVMAVSGGLLGQLLGLVTVRRAPRWASLLPFPGWTRAASSWCSASSCCCAARPC
jgi:uncharacterized protein